MSPLDAALPFDEADSGPAIPEEHLHLHVTGLSQILLEEEVGVAEIRAGHGPRGLKRFGQVFGSVHARHADPPAAGGRLEQHRIPEVRRNLAGLIHGTEDAIDALGDGHAGLRHRSTRGHFVARDRDRLGRRADEHDPRLRATHREVRLLRKESISRMDRVRPSLRGGA